MIYEPYIILGTGRSGTSIMAGILHHLGIFMGNTFVPKNKHNPRGYWEDTEFLHIRWLFDALNFCTEEEWYSELYPLIKRRFAMNIPWGWKDPGASEVLEFIVQILPKARYVWCKRQRAAVIESLCRCYGWDQKVSETHYNRRYDNIKQYIPSNHHIVQLEKLQSNPELVINKFLMWSGYRASPKQVTQALELVIMANVKGNSIKSNKEVGMPKGEIKDAKQPKGSKGKVGDRSKFNKKLSMNS